MSGQQDPNRPEWLCPAASRTSQLELEYRRLAEQARDYALQANPSVDDPASMREFCQITSQLFRSMKSLLEQIQAANNGAGVENEANAGLQNENEPMEEEGSAQQSNKRPSSSGDSIEQSLKVIKLDDSDKGQASASHLSFNACGMNYARTTILGHGVSYCADHPSVAMRSEPEGSWVLIGSSDKSVQNTWKCTDFLKINHQDYLELMMHGVSVLVAPKEGKTQEEIHVMKGPNGELGLILPE